MLRRQKGQGLVEFALVAPVLLLIILAIIETALIFQGYLAVQHAAREAARWAVTYKPDQGRNLDGTECDGTECSPDETDQQYWARRVRMIKDKAVASAVGLRIGPTGLTQADFNQYLNEPNFFGVEIWGYPSFYEPAGGWTEEDLRDHPGLPGLQVLVRVTHNVELLDPLFRAIVPRVRVSAQTEMINEGTHHGPIPTILPPPPPPPLPPVSPPPPPAGDTVEFFDTTFYVGEGDGEAIITVVRYAPSDDSINVNYATSDDTAEAGVDYEATGELLTFDPSVPSQTFTVSIIDDTREEGDETLILTLSGGNATIGSRNPARLVIVDNDGAIPTVDFSGPTYSVDEDAGTATITVILSRPSGETVTVGYATSDGTATESGDYTAVNGTLTFDPGVTSQSFEVPIADDTLDEGDETVNLILSSAVHAIIGDNSPALLTIRDDDEPPTPTPTGPFITASRYVVSPTQIILIDVYQHPINRTYSLVWVDAGGRVAEVISDTLRVDDDGSKRDIVFAIPADNQGVYHLETRLGSRDGPTEGASADIVVVPPPPDLVVSSIGVPGRTEPNQEITVTVEVANLTAGSVSGYFDVDLYVDPDDAPVPSQPGVSKVWIDRIDPLSTKVVTHVVTLYGGGAHELWAQVDTSDWVFEGDAGQEANNIFGPLGVTAAGSECQVDGVELSDRFYGPELDAKWIPARLGDANVHNMAIDAEEGALSIEANGTGMWDGPDNGTFLYQPVTGDFVATLKVVQPLQGSGQQWAKIGLMARASTAANSRWVTVMKTRDAVQFGFRTDSNGQRFASDATVGPPVWVRLVRNGDSFAGYYSTDGASWVAGTGDGENGGVTVDVPDTVLIGIAATSYSSTPATGIVDDFEVCPMDASAETCQGYSDDFADGSTVLWSDADIGNTLPGSSSRGGGTMTVVGDGADLWHSDNFHFTYQQVSGDFVATLKINAGPTLAQRSKAGLMVRDGADLGATNSPLVMVVKTRDAGVQFGARPSHGGSMERFANDTGDGTLPVWVRIVRSGNAFSAFYATSEGNWIYGGSTTVNLPEQVLIGMAVSSYSGSAVDGANFDDFVFCAGEAGGGIPPIEPPETKPPGLKECVQTIQLGGFEASQITPPWMRNVDAFHASSRKHTGSFSLEFRAKVSRPPALEHLTPWAYQSVAVPDSVLPDTTGTLSLWQFVAPDPPDREPDPDDHLYLVIRDSGGVTQTAAIPLVSGDAVTPVFQQSVISVENYLPGDRFVDFAGQEMQVYFYGVHDGDANGSYFYIDNVRFDICTVQPIPEPIEGTVSIGGLIEVLLAGVPTRMPGIQVWASRVGGELHRTQTIHDSTYHFYNVPPGTYIIYAEVWVGGYLYTATAEVQVAANERNYAVNLLLQ